jgi:aminopeptidase-like protein
VDREILNEILNEVSGERTWDLASQITRFDRVRGGGKGSGLNECVEWLANYLRELGAEEVKIHNFKADGVQKYFQWTSLPGWRVNEAELWVGDSRNELLTRYTDQPTSLMHYSKGCNLDSELVYVGKGKTEKDYAGRDVKGKIVFACGGDGYKVHREAVLKRGAAGVVVGPSDRGDRLKYPDLIEVYRLSPTGDELDKVGFGFSISKRMEGELLKKFESGKPVLTHVKIDAEIIPGDMPTLEALIVGSEFQQQEIVVMGHLDHYKPGANDNASGTAGMVEILRNIRSLVERGAIKKPKRTIRFLWVPELHGTIAYLWENRDIGKRAIAGMNLDMIGENTADCEATFNLTCSPYSTPGYINDVMTNLIPWLDEDGFFSPKGSRLRFNHRIRPYSGGSDHYMFCDPTFNIPTLMLGHRNVFHHTNMDTMKTCDPTELKRIIGLAEATIIFLANTSDDDAVKISGEVCYKALVRMADRTRRSVLLINQVASDPARRGSLTELYHNLREYPGLQAECEALNILEIKELCGKVISKSLITNLSQTPIERAKIETSSIENTYNQYAEMYDQSPIDKERAALYGKAASIKPKRLFEGPLNSDYDRQRYIWDEIRERIGNERADWYEKHESLSGGSKESKVSEICNLMNGERTLLDIRHLVSLEYDETDIEFVLHLYEDLANLGLVSN